MLQTKNLNLLTNVLRILIQNRQKDFRGGKVHAYCKIFRSLMVRKVGAQKFDVLSMLWTGDCKQMVNCG